jgi:hypothetical protein
MGVVHPQAIVQVKKLSSPQTIPPSRENCLKMPRSKVPPEDKKKIDAAVEWLLPLSPDLREKLITAAKIYGVPQYVAAIRMAARRAPHKKRNNKDLYNKLGGHNKILSDEEEYV